MNGQDQITLLRSRMETLRARRRGIAATDLQALEAFNAVAANNKPKAVYDHLAEHLEQLKQGISTD